MACFSPVPAVFKSAAKGYSTYPTAHTGNRAANLDFDNDGVTNGIEFSHEETGSTLTTDPAIVTGSVTWPKSASFSGDGK